MLMRSNYAIELSNVIFDLELIKEELLKDKSFGNRVCHCKAVIFDNYISICQILYIRITARIIKYLEELYMNNKNKNLSIEDIKEIVSFDELHKWFNYYSYKKLYKYPNISKKILILFEQIQSLIDETLFNYLKNEYINRLNEVVIDNDDLNEKLIYDCLKNIYLDMRNWFETSAFNILALNVDCNSIKDDIFICSKKYEIVNKDFCIDEYIKSDKCTKDEVQKICYTNCENGECKTHKYVTSTSEFIHLVILPEMINNRKWCFNFITLFEKYHKHPKNIDFYLDYILIDNMDYKWDNTHSEMLEKMLNIFRNIYVINYDHIDTTNIDEDVKDKIMFDITPDYFKNTYIDEKLIK